MDRHVQQGLVTVVLAVLIIFSTNAFSLIGDGDEFGITTIQAKKKTHRSPNLLDQQIAISVGLDINPNWVREQDVADSLIYGTVEPDDTTPAGINGDYSYLVTNDRDKEISLFSKADKRKVMIKYANHGEGLCARTVLLSRLAEWPYRTKRQRRQVNKYASVLRTEQLIRHRKLGL